ncbi:MAG: mechanosensitive ion channel [gamma proteobacterium symbiont of Bathyaustriella thionipta]|nr:mechanosensitive ion channel [gamma proteobacterium symbiont of Bathyaustriella thionipta]
MALLLAGLLIPVAGLSAENASVTTANENIRTGELSLKLKALTRSQLKVEADAWLALLAKKVAEISEAEIAVKYKLAEISQAEKLEDAHQKVKEISDQPPAESKDDEKTKALEASKKNRQEARLAYQKILAESRKMVKRHKANTAVDAVTARAQSYVNSLQKDAPEDDEEQPQDNADKQAIDETQRKIDEAVAKRDLDRDNLLDYLTYLRAKQTKLVDLTNVVIAAFEKKGGDAEQVKEYRQYVNAVSGVQVDVSDWEATWKTLSGWMMSDEGGLRLAKNFSLFLLIVLAFIILSRFASKAVEKVTSRTAQASHLLSDFLVVTVRRLIVAIGIIIGLAALEVNIGPLLAVIGAAGFVVAFALQDSLGNFASGILIMVFKPFDTGDLVEIDGVLGKVQSMNLLSVQLHTLDNRAVIVPNNNVWNSAITNVNGTRTRRIDMVFGIGYSDDMGKAQSLIEAVVAAHPLVLKDPQPVVRVFELGDSSVNFVCRPWVKSTDYWEVYWDVTRSVKESFDQEGVSIPFPQRDLHIIDQAPLPSPFSQGTAPTPVSESSLKAAADSDLSD